MNSKSRPLIRYWNSQQYQVSFLGIPKTGSSTVRKILGIDTESEWSLQPEYSQVFTVLREPTERIKSGYQECKRRRTLRPGTTCFGSFVKSIEQCDFFDEHIRPMSYYFNDQVSHVFALDNLSTLWSWLNIVLVNDIKENASKAYDIGTRS